MEIKLRRGEFVFSKVADGLGEFLLGDSGLRRFGIIGNDRLEIAFGEFGVFLNDCSSR